MPMLKALDSDKTFTLQCSGKHDRRTASKSAGGFIGGKQLGNAVPINAQYSPAEGFPAGFVDFEFPLQHSRLTLAQPIDVDGRTEIVEAVESRPLRSLPYRAFRRFAVAHQNINALIRILELFRINGDSRSNRQALTQRTGRYVHERQAGSGVAFQIRIDL